MKKAKFRNLSKEEMINNNGGYVWLRYVAELVVSGAIYDCLAHWGETKKSFHKGLQAGMNDF